MITETNMSQQRHKEFLALYEAWMRASATAVETDDPIESTSADAAAEAIFARMTALRPHVEDGLPYGMVKDLWVPDAPADVFKLVR